MRLVEAAVGLSVLAALDATFAGFRGSVGRDGRVRHRADDLRYAARGLGWGALLLMPAVVAVLLDLRDPVRHDLWRVAAERMLLLYVPYATVGLAGIAAYLALGWRRRFLANALVLGPFTLARPLVVVAGGLLAGASAHDARAWLVVTWCVAATLLVGPVVGLRWRHRKVG